MTFCACTSSGETASASSSTVSSPAAAVSCGRNPIVAFFSIAIVPLSGETSPRINEKSVDLPAPFGPTNPIRLPRLTWSDTSSKSARPAKDFESWETVSITESAQCSLVRRLVQLRVAHTDLDHDLYLFRDPTCPVCDPHRPSSDPSGSFRPSHQRLRWSLVTRHTSLALTPFATVPS